MAPSAAELRRLAASRPIEHVVVLGANGTMGYGSAALFTQAVPRVTLLARTREKAARRPRRRDQAGALADRREPRRRSGATRSSTRSSRARTSCSKPLTEDFALKQQMFDRVEKARRADAIVATVTSRPLDQRAGRGAQRSVPPPLPGPPPLQSAERDRRHRADRRARHRSRRSSTSSRPSRACGSGARSCARTTRRPSRATASASRC